MPSRPLTKIAAVVALPFSLAAPALAACDPYIGEIQTFAFDFCPVGFAPLNGQLLDISSNTSLFQLIGTTYGGNGTSTFALPMAKPIITATGVPLLQCIAVEGIFPPRE